MKVAGLFAGIGGFELGLGKSGHETTFLSEIEPGANTILRKEFPGIDLAEDNVMGVRLPRLGRVALCRRPYALLAKPEWVDRLAELLAATLDLRVQVQVERRRLDLLDEAVRTITQRVNLFEKVLIPRTRANIKRIRIFLADGERAAVVRAKIAKAKRAREARA